ncbi:TPA: rhodanese-like domain-containing protein [Candidatus Scatousia excrementigallinarum]|uniref:Rhodanese-like domain-containing protein n=1 Tax=Candidatus Scatousia excrementigallinarum TaxID=2840935 RepID=A0A9D1EYD5_9BACT|nr:rhodanese-like domain-containing protein [Candidatus Scatousia excrementigallinarum]
MDDKIKEIRFDSTRAKNFFEEYLAFTIGPVDLKNLLDEGAVTLLDVRREADYAVSHIPNALSIPKEELADNLDKLDKNVTTVIYSYNEQCHLSVKAALILADYGYPCVILEGGFKTWKEDFRFAST